MYERHENEQYFFDPPTLARLADFIAAAYRAPCCLCVPLLGRELAARGVPVRILDIDERFAGLPGFRRFDLYRPEWLGETFDLIVCDPPFYQVSLSQLFHALRMLAGYDFRQALLLSYLVRRDANVIGTFAHFGLQPTGYRPGYRTVQRVPRNEIEFFGNLGEIQHGRLARILSDSRNAVSHIPPA